MKAAKKLPYLVQRAKPPLHKKMCKEASIINIQYSYIQLLWDPDHCYLHLCIQFSRFISNSPFTLSPFEDDPKKNKMISALTVLREMN